MLIRKTKENDVKRMMDIVEQAQEYMRMQGIDQWQNGYPNEEAFKMDILSDMSYVVEEQGKVIGTFAFAVMEEPTYKEIYEGEWKSKEEYAVMHRVAVDNQAKGHGIGGQMIDYVTKKCREQNISSIRIDTHRDNQSMQKMLLKNGMEKRGIIYLESGAERIAFEKILE